MRKVLGQESIFYIKYNDVWCPIACETSSPISESVEMVNTTTRDNYGWISEKPTLQSYSISVNGVLVNETGNTLSLFRLRQMKRNKILIEWKRETLGLRYIDSGRATITEISDENEVDGEVTFTMSLKGFGEPSFVEDTSVVVAEVLSNSNDAIVANSNEDKLLV